MCRDSRSLSTRPTLLIIGVLIGIAIALSFTMRPQIEELRPLGTKALRVLGINDFLRYRVHIWSGEVALGLDLPEPAVQQYAKAEAHASNDAERSAALAGHGEALAAMGAHHEAEEALRRAIILDPHNTRASQILDKLRRNGEQ